MIRITILIYTLIISIRLYGQQSDTCQCRFIYGNAIHPTLVTYHHDTIVSYRNSIYPKDTLYKLLAAKTPIEKTLLPEYYNWHKFTIDHFYQVGSIGTYLNKQYYPEYFFNTISLDSQYNAYYVRYNKSYKDTFLSQYKYEIESYQKINGQICNCYNSDNYTYTGDYRMLELTKENLNKIESQDDGSLSDTVNHFIWDDGCRMGLSKTCYLKGVGLVSIDYPFPDNYVLKINYLDSTCKTFFKTKLGISIE